MTKPLDPDDTRLLSRYTRAKVRLRAWCRILDAVDELRNALEHRIWREDPTDTDLEHDVENFAELARALANFLEKDKAA